MPPWSLFNTCWPASPTLFNRSQCKVFPFLKICMILCTNFIFIYRCLSFICFFSLKAFRHFVKNGGKYLFIFNIHAYLKHFVGICCPKGHLNMRSQGSNCSLDSEKAWTWNIKYLIWKQIFLPFDVCFKVLKQKAAAGQQVHLCQSHKRGRKIKTDSECFYFFFTHLCVCV